MMQILCIMYCSMFCMTYQKLLVFRDYRKPRFGAKSTEIDENSRKMGKSYFLFDFPFPTKVTECSMYSTVPCLTYQTF